MSSSSKGIVKLWLYVCVWFVLVFGVAYALPSWIGADAEPQSSASFTTSDFTFIYDEAAAITGTIDSIEYFTDDNTSGSVFFGVFSKSGSNFTDVQSATGLDATADALIQLGAPADFTAMAISTGEYIGFYISTGTMDKATSGGGGYWFFSGNAIDGGDADAFTQSGNTTHDIQIRAYITAVGGEPDISHVRRIKEGEGK